mgnify:CR=1 FL=1
MSGNFSVTFHSYLKSKQFLKNYICSLVLKVIWIRKSGAVPSHIISSSDVVTAGWTIGILLKSCISGHVFICKSYCLAVIITIRCTGSCNLASCIRSGRSRHSYRNTVQERSMYDRHHIRYHQDILSILFWTDSSGSHKFPILMYSYNNCRFLLIQPYNYFHFS